MGGVRIEGSLDRPYHTALGPSVQPRSTAMTFDGDGKPEIVFGTRLHVVRAEDGKELWSEELRVGEGIYEGGGAPLILDLDGDGHLDIFLVMGRGLSDDTRPPIYGRAIALRAGKGNQWLTFRGGPQRIGTPSD